MRSVWLSLLVCTALAFTALAFTALVASPALAQRQFKPDVVNALSRYVEKPDASYGWKQRRSGRLGTATYTELTLTSQTWQNNKWRHQLYIIRPSSVSKDVHHALLLVSGGSWRDEYAKPAQDDKLPGEARLLAAAAEEMGTPVAIVSQVPFQPMFDGKKEDEIISYTFEQFLNTGDTEWPLLLPMVKAAVRAMDAVQDYSQQEWSHAIDTFTVTGASKRGWTTWLTGATDARATAIAPMVIDVLNMQKHMEHQIDTWGEYSEQISDYTERGLQDHLASEPGAALRRIVDPYHHLENIQQPKLLMIGTNDRYWPLDSLNLYWDDLAGDKHVLYVPNNGHGLNDFQRVIGSLNALHQMAARGKVLPKIDWSFMRDDDSLLLHVESDQPPRKVQAWTAMAPKRDFRDAKWSAELAKKNGGKFVYRLPIPTVGFAAVFGEAVFDGGKLPFYLSTNVRIVSGSDEQ